MNVLQSGWRPIAICGVLLVAGFGLERLDPFPEDRFEIQASPDTLPSTRAVPPIEVVQGTELLSLVIDEQALSGTERGLLTHPEERGREWERAGYISFFTDGQLRLATRAGVRLHGGRSRLYSPVKSFRLYFRPKYGPPAVPSETLFGDTPLENNLTRIIVHNDIRHDRTKREWHMVNPLAYDIAARLGGIVPRTRPIRFFLNGEQQGVYVLTEHISPEFLEARFGHRNFSINESAERRRLARWISATRPFTMDAVEEGVNLENLTSWALTILFCATTDVVTQSPIVRDLTNPHARWFWITWDLDHSFMDLYRSAPTPWLLDSYRTLLGNREERSRILTRLLLHDADYRLYFSGRLAAALNHQLTPAFLSERLLHYREAAVRRGATDVRYIEILERFFAERPQVLWDLTVKHLKMKEPLTVTIKGPAGVAVNIDGFKTALPYRGKYLPGTPFVLDGSPAVDRWSVDGRTHDGQVSFLVSANVTIEAAGHIAQQSPR